MNRTAAAARGSHHHRVRVGICKRIFFCVMGLVGLCVLTYLSYEQFLRTGTTGRDIWFAIHLPMYFVTACVCVGLVCAAFTRRDWYTFVPYFHEPPFSQDVGDEQPPMT